MITDKLHGIILDAARLEDRIIAAGTATERDMLMARELVNRYIDELQRLEETITVPPYMTGDEVADFILKRMYPDG